MMHKLTGALALAGAVMLAGGGTPANAQPANATKDALKCSSTKLKTIGKDWAAKLKCYSKAVVKGVAVDAECLSKAEAKTVDSFGKADLKGGCPTDSNAFNLNNDGIQDGLIGSILNQTNLGFNITTTVIYRGINGPVLPSTVNEGLVPTATPAGLTTLSKCTSKKLGELGKYAAALFTCESKAAGKNLVTDVACIDKATTKALEKIAKEEAKVPNDCQTTGDGEFLASEVFRTFQRIVPSVARFDGCGNGLIVGGETCDDGNFGNFDNCPADCTVSTCTPTAAAQPVTVTINNPTAAQATIELDYPENLVSLPGVGFEADVVNLTAGVLDALDFEHAIRLVASDAASFGQVEIAQLNFVDCMGASGLDPSDFACTVTSASGPGGTPNLTETTTCTVTIP